MRVALLSDIHGNRIALDAVLEDIGRREVDQIVCLGDVAATGPQPVEALRRIQDLGCPVVRGNADEWHLETAIVDSDLHRKVSAIDDWCAEQLNDSDRAFLQTFQPTLSIGLGQDAILFCYHGSPRSNTEAILADTPEDELEAMLAGNGALILAGGHTHQQMLRRFRTHILINPGSVGLGFERLGAEQDRNVPWAEYALVNWQDGHLEIEFCRAPFDLSALKQAALDSGMPYAQWWVSEWPD